MSQSYDAGIDLLRDAIDAIHAGVLLEVMMLDGIQRIGIYDVVVATRVYDEIIWLAILGKLYDGQFCGIEIALETKCFLLSGKQ